MRTWHVTITAHRLGAKPITVVRLVEARTADVAARRAIQHTAKQCATRRHPIMQWTLIIVDARIGEIKT